MSINTKIIVWLVFYTFSLQCVYSQDMDTLKFYSKCELWTEFKSEGYNLSLYSDSLYFLSITCGYEKCSVSGFSMGTYYVQDEQIVFKDLDKKNIKAFEKLVDKLKLYEFTNIDERYVFNFKLIDNVGDSLTGQYLRDSLIILPSTYHFRDQWSCNTNTPLFNDVYDLGYSIVPKPFSEGNSVGIVDIPLWDSNEDTVFCEVSGIITNIYQHGDSLYRIDIFNGCGMSYLRRVSDFNLRLEEGDYIERGTIIGLNKSRRVFYYLRSYGLIKE